MEFINLLTEDRVDILDRVSTEWSIETAHKKFLLVRQEGNRQRQVNTNNSYKSANYL